MRELFSRIAACREHSFCSRRLREIYFITPIKPFARETVLTSCACLSQHRAAESGRRGSPFKNASAAFIEKSPLHYPGSMDQRWLKARAQNCAPRSEPEQVQR
jgi:hypothetical protein